MLKDNKAKVKETIKTPISAYFILPLHLILIAAAIASITILKQVALFIPLTILCIFLLRGYFIVNPNESKVLILFGDYVGTVKKYGFFWANPFYQKRMISLRARNLDSDKIKVNDSIGNPVIISAVVVWQVEDTAKAAFEVDDYIYFVKVQSESALRSLAGLYPYDDFDEEEQGKEQELTLRSGGEQVNDELEKELSERLGMAGIKIIEARLNHLAYAEEIAGAMLQRQQATAIIAARRKIVEGAVGMVKMALDDLAEGEIVEMDEDKKAAMVSNLMVVLCGDRSPTPVVNTGTLYH